MLNCCRPAPSPAAKPFPLFRRCLASALFLGRSTSSRRFPRPGFVQAARAPASGAGVDPFRGKPGTVSFSGVTHHLLERKGLVSAPFEEGKGSLLWLIGPLALIASLVVPQFFLASAVELAVGKGMIAEIMKCLSSEIIFYIGLSTFLSVTDRVQRPYLELSSKRWSLITGLKGYLSSAFLVMGIKVFAPILAAYIAWPDIGLPAVIVVVPFLMGLLAQFFMEVKLEQRGSSCWPVLPIIFEVYRLYQLNKGAHFIERFMFSVAKTASRTNRPELMERSGAFVPMLIVLQVLGVVCLWSLTTFLIRLFPSRPVTENY